jgi:hypothetical protein
MTVAQSCGCGMGVKKEKSLLSGEAEEAFRDSGPAFQAG